jgi:hypothetical protein
MLVAPTHHRYEMRLRLPACSPEHAPTAPEFGYALVRISPTMLSYGAGASVRLELENVGPTAIFAGPCPDALERFVGPAWAVVNTFGATCELSLVMIQPGVIGPGVVTLPVALSTGLYRARYDRISAVGANQTNLLIGARFSESFAVTAAAAR